MTLTVLRGTLTVVLRESGYNQDELEHIYTRELNPVLIFNLLDVAGEWAGFSEPWLISKLTAQLENPSSYSDTSLTDSNWKDICRRLNSNWVLRGGN